MDQNNRPPRQYSGTRGLTPAVVIGVAIGTVIGKMTGNMNTGLMLGLVIGVLGWFLLTNKGSKQENADRDSGTGELSGDETEKQERK